MRKPRLLIPDSFSCGVYHIVSRATNREFIFGDDEKEHLVRLMKRYATFSKKVTDTNGANLRGVEDDFDPEKAYL